MIRLYIIVQTNKSAYNERSMVTRNSEREVVHHAGILASATGLEDGIVIDRIFSVNEYGHIDDHEIEFKDGKLKLSSPIPQIQYFTSKEQKQHGN